MVSLGIPEAGHVFQPSRFQRFRRFECVLNLKLLRGTEVLCLLDIPWWNPSTLDRSFRFRGHSNRHGVLWIEGCFAAGYIHSNFIKLSKSWPPTAWVLVRFLCYSDSHQSPWVGFWFFVLVAHFRVIMLIRRRLISPYVFSPGQSSCQSAQHVDLLYIYPPTIPYSHGGPIIVGPLFGNSCICCMPVCSTTTSSVRLFLTRWSSPQTPFPLVTGTSTFDITNLWYPLHNRSLACFSYVVTKVGMAKICSTKPSQTIVFIGIRFSSGLLNSL